MDDASCSRGTEQQLEAHTWGASPWINRSMLHQAIERDILHGRVWLVWCGSRPLCGWRFSNVTVCSIGGAAGIKRLVPIISISSSIYTLLTTAF